MSKVGFARCQSHGFASPLGRLFSAKGAAFIGSLGQRPRVYSGQDASAEGAIHFLRRRAEVIRAFSAWIRAIKLLGRCPRLK